MDLVSSIKALSKEKRVDLGRSIRKDPDLYNAMNGMGGVSESANKGLFKGTITKVSVPLQDLDVQAIDGSGTTFTAKTNNVGYYQIELVDGNYTAKVTFEGVSKSQAIKIVKGETTIFNHDFE
jgi:hypothetical protein